MGVDDLGPTLLAASAVLLVAVVAVRLQRPERACRRCCSTWASGSRSASGASGSGSTTPRLTGVLGYGALIVILAEGGITTRWARIRPAVRPAAVLATVGALVSVAVVGRRGARSSSGST